MKYNKLLLSVLCAGFITTSVMADAEVKIEDKTITITCDAPQGKRTAMTAVRKNHSLSEQDWVVAVKESDENNGKAVFSFNMPDVVNSESADGKYVIYTKSAGVKESTEFLYVSPETISRVNGLFATVTTSIDLEAIFADVNNALALEFMGFDVASYNTLSAEYKAVACQAMFGEIEDFAVAETKDILDAYQKALIVSYINSSTSSDTLGNVLTGFKFADVTYKDITDAELIKWINKCVFAHKPYAGYENVIKEYNNDNILYIINNARFSSIKSLLETYAADLGISQDTVYIAYKAKADNGPLNESIASNLGSQKPDTVAKLVNVLNSAMNPGGSQSGGGSGGGGGGASGGGGGGSSQKKPSTGNYEEGSASKPTLVVPIEKESPVEEKALFDDVATDFWGAEAIKTLVANKIIAGDGNGKFRPNDRISREEFIKMAVSILGEVNENAKCSFDDVSEKDWYYKYVATAVDAGIIYGVTDTVFGSGQGLTRQDMAVICERAFGGKIASVRGDADFADEDTIAPYARDAVHKLYTSGVVNGMDDNSFAPTAYATRAQAAQILYGLCYNK